MGTILFLKQNSVQDGKKTHPSSLTMMQRKVSMPFRVPYNWRCNEMEMRIEDFSESYYAFICCSRFITGD